jgi:hypothetical protein
VIEFHENEKKGIAIALFAFMSLILIIIATKSPRSGTAAREYVLRPVENGVDGVSRSELPSAERIATTNDLIPSNIDRFTELSEKALLSTAEQIELERLLSDPKGLRAIEVTLLQNESPSFTKQKQIQRFEMLHLLERSLQWADNPLRNDLLLTLERLIEARNTDVDDEVIQRSLVGDKMELYGMLLMADPPRAQMLKEKVAGTKLSPIIEYAEQRFSR